MPQSFQWNVHKNNPVDDFTTGSFREVQVSSSSHWILNGLYGGTSPKHIVEARPGLRIKAVFVDSAG